MTNKKIASEIAVRIILLVAVAIGGIFWWQNQKSIQQPEQRACTMEAKLCDDGSYVSRTGPNCEFAPCPENESAQMANPASTYCMENGGESEIRTAEDGSQTGYCKFDDGSECEEWAYFRKECDKGNLGATINTSSWQTYKNDKHGFEFKYPDNLNITEKINADEGPDFGIIINIGENIIVNVVKIEKGMQNGSDPLSEPNGMDPVSQRDITIAGTKGRIYNDGEVYVVAKNGYQYFLMVSDVKKLEKDLLEKIIPTFKFTK
jgi:putative hemolysin